MNITGDPKAIASAFIKARGQMEATVTKDAKGNFGKYATLAAIVEATTEILAKNGLAIMQEVSSDEAGVTVDTWLIHDSGAMMQFKPLTMPCDRKPQSVGSAATYGRRYALAAICGLAPDDDDAEAAQASTQPAKTAQKAVAPRKDAQAPVVPTDAELAILGAWQTPQDAQKWALEKGTCKNEFEAKQSFKNVVDEHGGRLTKENVALVYLLFLRKHVSKLAVAA